MSQSIELEYLLTVNTDQCVGEIRRLESALMRALHLFSILGLPPKIEEQIREIQRIIVAINSLTTAYHALQVARMAAGDPIAWATAGIQVATTIVSLGNQIEYSTRGR